MEGIRKALSSGGSTRAMRQALKVAAIRVWRKASFNLRGGHPLYERTGDLRSSLDAVFDFAALVARVGIPSRTFYGKVHEYGMTIVPRVKQALRFPVTARGSKPVNPATWKGPWATVKKVVIPARPWLHPAYDESKQQIIEDFRAALERNLKP